MDNQLWSWALGIIGVVGFILAGRKVWWSWYINLGCQILWFAYSSITEQWGFFVTAIVYTWVFSQNAYRWTKDRHPAPVRDYEAELNAAHSVSAGWQDKYYDMENQFQNLQGTNAILAARLEEQFRKDV